LGSGTTAWRAPSSETAALRLGDGVAGAHSSETGTGTTTQYQPGDVLGSGRELGFLLEPSSLLYCIHITGGFLEKPLVIYNITSAFFILTACDM
jgi:hypothetical protein